MAKGSIKPGEDSPEENITELATLRRELGEAKKKGEEYLAGWQRAQADFANYKRRTEQEQAAFVQCANAELILSLLPVLDDLERAFSAVPAEFAGNEWLEGFRLIERKFRAGLEAQGLKPVKVVGEPFDPRLHEAVRQEQGEEGIVVAEMKKGYLLNDRLLRPAQVVVGNGENKEQGDRANG